MDFVDRILSKHVHEFVLKVAFLAANHGSHTILFADSPAPGLQLYFSGKSKDESFFLQQLPLLLALPLGLFMDCFHLAKRSHDGPNILSKQRYFKIAQWTYLLAQFFCF